MKTYEGKLLAQDLKFALVVSRFNEFISKNLLSGAIDAILRHGGDEKNIEVFWAPGSWEIPLLAKKVAEKDMFNAIICIGAVIRGATPHFDYIATEVAKGIAKTSLDFGVPISFGILTCDTIEQAIERAGTKSGNKGFDAAVSAIETANLIKSIGS